MTLVETDSAGSNVRLSAYQLAQAAQFEHYAHWYCSLHQCQLVEGAVTGLYSHLKLMSKLYSLSLLLKGGGLFMRMKSALKGILQSTHIGLAIRPGPPPPDARAFAIEPVKYMVCHYQRYAISQASRKYHFMDASPDSDSDEGDDMGVDRLPNVKHKGLRAFWQALLTLMANARHCVLWYCRQGYTD